MNYTQRTCKDCGEVYIVDEYSVDCGKPKQKDIKEINMSEYKRGVEDATKHITEKTILKRSVGGNYWNTINLYLDYVRKELLTKKATKWLALYNNEGSGCYKALSTDCWKNNYPSRLFDSYQEAKEALEGLTFGAIVSIEVEVLID